MSKELHACCENIRRAVKNMPRELKPKECLLQETLQHWRIDSNWYDALIQWLQEGEYILRRSSEEKLVRLPSPSSSLGHSFSSFWIISPIWSIGDRSIDFGVWRRTGGCPAQQTFLSQSTMERNHRVRPTVPPTRIHSKETRRFLHWTIEVTRDIGEDRDRDASSTSLYQQKIERTRESSLREFQEVLFFFSLIDLINAGSSSRVGDVHGECSSLGSSQSEHCSREWWKQYFVGDEFSSADLFRQIASHRRISAVDSQTKQSSSRTFAQVRRAADEVKRNDAKGQRGFPTVEFPFQRRTASTTDRSIGSNTRLFLTLCSFVHFQQLSEQVIYWEKEFSLHSQLWKEFDQRLKRLEKWIDHGQQVVQEKSEDLVYLIEKHENFFQLLDEEIFHGFISAGGDYLVSEIETIKKRRFKDWWIIFKVNGV